MLDAVRLWARIVGLCVAAASAVAATQFLTLGFETKPLMTTDTVATLTDWIRRPPMPGPGVLAAIALAVAGFAALAGTVWPRRGPSAITTRRRLGWTRIDRRSLEAAIQRRLEALDRRSDLNTTVHRSGRVDIEVVTIDTALDGPGAKVRDALEELCVERQLPCRPGVVTVQGRKSTKRRNTIQ